MKRILVAVMAALLSVASVAFAADVKDSRGNAVVSDGRGNSAVPAPFNSTPTSTPVAVVSGTGGSTLSVPRY